MKKGKNKKKAKDKKKHRKLKQASTKKSPKELKREVKRLQQELRQRDELILELKGGQGQVSATGIDKSLPSKPRPNPKKESVALTHRKAWERHQFLRSQYEFHLESGESKGRARAKADRDLRRRYGDDAGYTHEQLDAILS